MELEAPPTLVVTVHAPPSTRPNTPGPALRPVRGALFSAASLRGGVRRRRVRAKGLGRHAQSHRSQIVGLRGVGWAHGVVTTEHAQLRVRLPAWLEGIDCLPCTEGQRGIECLLEIPWKSIRCCPGSVGSGDRLRATQSDPIVPQVTFSEPFSQGLSFPL